MQEFIPMAIEFAQNHTLLSIAWVALLVALIVTTVQSITSKVKRIDNNNAILLINRENALVVDLRGHDEFKRGHIINSFHLLPSDIKNRNLGKLEQHKNTPIILTCATGMSASSSASLLIKNGFKQVYVLSKGIIGWSNENLPLVKGNLRK